MTARWRRATPTAARPRPRRWSLMKSPPSNGHKDPAHCVTMPKSPGAAASLAPASSVSLYDKRPFFEKALIFGVQHGIIDPQKLDAIGNEAPKGMVQIARYFGTEFLRPELEKAKDRIINLVS